MIRDGLGDMERPKELLNAVQLINEIVSARFLESGGICGHSLSPQPFGACGNKYSDKDSASNSSDSFEP